MRSARLMLIAAPCMLSLVLVASCASREKIHREATDDVSVCLQQGQTRVQVSRCLSSVGFPDDKIHAGRAGTSIVATRCRGAYMPGFASCAVFEGFFDGDGHLATWSVVPAHDRP
jgi:hypothetical protein